jgi:hypothetical protein
LTSLVRLPLSVTFEVALGGIVLPSGILMSSGLPAGLTTPAFAVQPCTGWPVAETSRPLASKEKEPARV